LFCDAGSVISGYQVNGSWHLIAKGNPQWPQVTDILLAADYTDFYSVFIL